MALGLMHYNVIVPFPRLGGHDGLSVFRPDAIGRNVWYDRHLVRVGGGMGHDSVEMCLAEPWARELQQTRLVDGEPRWQDVCVALSQSGFFDHGCDWLQFDERLNAVAAHDDWEPRVIAPIDPPGPEVAGTWIRGRLDSGHAPEAGIVRVDKLAFAFNVDTVGAFAVFVPSVAVKGLNRESDEHVLTVENLRTETTTPMEFRLPESGVVELPVVR